MRRILPFATLALLTTVAAYSPAAEPEKKADDKAGDATKGDKPADGDKAAGDKAEPAKDEGGMMKSDTSKTKDVESPNDPKEDPSKTYYFIGARYRHTILPKWMLNLFVAGGPENGVSIPAFGIEGSMRKDGFDTILSITYADWSMKTFPFKGKDEADTAYELVTSSLKLINLTVDMLWSTDFSKQFAFTYGATAGIALVLGDLARVQAKPGDSTNDPYKYVPCSGPGDPTAAGYCDRANDHYGDYKEPSWFSGGKLPNIYAVFGPQLGFRYKPVKQFAARLDVGFNLFAGFFFGLGVDYGL